MFCGISNKSRGADDMLRATRDMFCETRDMAGATRNVFCGTRDMARATRNVAGGVQNMFCVRCCCL